MLKILVIDLEALCWDKQPERRNEMEIIEIGCVVLETAPDKQWEILDKFSLLVKPQHEQVSQFCEDLTGITQKALEDGGMELAEAMEILKETHATLWCSWGMWDYDTFKRECQYKDIKMWQMLPIAHLNAKALFSAKYRTGKKGLSSALGHLGMPFIGTPHRGMDDAENIAEILRKILNGG